MRGLARRLSERLDIDDSRPHCECLRMYASCVLIGPATLRRMYVDELRTTDQIAAHFGCSGHNGPATPTAVQDSRSATWTLWRSDPASSWLRSDISSVVGRRRLRGRTDRDGWQPGAEETGYHTRVQGHRSARNGPTLPRFDRTDQIA